jgi:glucokinase
MSGELFLGVDCGGTNLRAAAAGVDGVLVAELVLPTGDAADRENGLGEAILALVARLVAGLPSGRSLGGIGVGLPFVCHDGRVWLHRNVEALDPAALEAGLRRRFGAPAALLNDVKCAALGEAWLGAARGADPFLYVNVGTGLSSALYSGGRLHRGAHEASGEIAYWLTETGGVTPGGGSRASERLGPLEEEMSGVGLSNAYARAEGSPNGPTAEEIFRRAARGEALAAATIERGLGFLLPALANLATFTDPGLLVLGGGIAKGLLAYRARIEDYLERMTPFPPKLAFSALGGRAGLLGALRLALAQTG